MTKRRHSDDDNETLQPQCKWHVGAREVDALNSEQMQVVYDKTRKLLVDGSKCQVAEQDPIRAANPLAYKCVTCTRESSICKCSFCNQYVCTVCVRFCSRCHYDFCHLCSTLRYGQKNEDAVCLTCY